MSDNTTLAMTSGIDTKRITTITWFLSGALAGVAGTVLGISEGNLTPASGELFLFVIFAAVIVGGVGSIYGAMAGRILIGLATEISAAFINPSYKLDIAFVILILALLIRPSGLFARAGDGVGMTYYVFTLVFFLFDYFILAMGLNIQYGETGILNFAYIGFVAIGAYFTGVFSLPQRRGTAGSTTSSGSACRSRSTCCSAGSRRCASRWSSRSSRSGGSGRTTSRSS